MTRSGFALARALVLSVVACSNTPTLPVATPTVAQTASATIVKPVTTGEPAVPPTYVRWAVDRSGNPDRPYFLDFFFDGVATNFRILDSSGQVAFRVPIAGSGVFGARSCMSARAPGKTENATWLVIDAVTLERFVRDAASYRIEADSVGGRTVTVPLTDTGCREP